jgi:hypothetical protein
MERAAARRRSKRRLAVVEQAPGGVGAGVGDRARLQTRRDLTSTAGPQNAPEAEEGAGGDAEAHPD